MGAGRKTQTINVKEKSLPASWTVNGIDTARNLRMTDLAAVIFGCKHSTIEECFTNSLFGLPVPHYMYVKNIYPGMPLFLFNYSDRKLHGIFEAATHGRLNINPQAWTEDGSDFTPYAAQVKFRTKVQCQPLVEDQFRPLIAENYYTSKLFWFELDQNQTKKLISLFSSLSIPQNQNSLLKSSFGSNAREKQRPEGKADDDAGVKGKDRDVVCVKPNSGISYSSIVKNVCTSVVQTDQSTSATLTVSGLATSLPRKPWSALFSKETVSDSRREVEDSEAPDKGDYSNSGLEASSDTRLEAQVSSLPEDCYNSEWSSSSISPSLLEDIQPPDLDEEHLTNEANHEAMANMVIAEENQVEQTQANMAHAQEAHSCDMKTPGFDSILAKLLLEVEELKGSQLMQAQKINILEQELIESRMEMQHLKDICKLFESSDLVSEELLLIAGGYDGSLWLSCLDSYSPFQDLVKPLCSMNFARSHASAVNLNGELYVFGGVHGDLWHDTVESYNPSNNQWVSRPSLSKRKGHLGGVSLNNKIFAVGGGTENECLSEVEMLDVNAAKWIPIQSMLEKRYAPAAAEISNIVYVAGGYNEGGYLNSVERYDPREHSWTRMGSMNMKRGWHSLTVLNEKLYALGGYDGQRMASTVEIFDPRLGSWMMEGSMSLARGYFGAVVMGDAIYVIGGLSDTGTVLDTVECYKKNQGWKATGLKGVGRRCFFCAAVV